MPDDASTLPMIAAHGADRLQAVQIDGYNVELKDDEGFLGDRASKGAFRDLVENWRKLLRKNGEDPFGDEPSEKLTKKQLDEAMTKGSLEAASVIHSAIEEFAQELALVIRRFLKLKAWKDTERFVIGGGFRNSRVGELSIARCSIILKADGINVQLMPIRNDPDEAGLIGAAHLAPKWLFKGYDAILAVDIGGTPAQNRRHQLGDLARAVDASVRIFDGDPHPSGQDVLEVQCAFGRGRIYRLDPKVDRRVRDRRQ